MSKQAGNNASKSATASRPATQPKLSEMKAEVIQKQVEAKKAENEASKQAVVATKPHPNIADSKLTNDAFSVYDNVDIDALTEAAVIAYKEGERSSRREGQMQIANILARYHQDKFLGDSNPAGLYKNDKLQIGTVQLIARHIYQVPEKTMDGKKNPLPRNLEMRVRNIAPIVFYAIQERIPLVWSDEHDALLVPAWFATSDIAMVNVFRDNPESRIAFNKPVALDGKEGRSLATLLKRTPDPVKAARQRESGQGALSGEEKAKQALKTGIGNAGLARSLVVITDLMSKHAHKPFSDEIVELLAVCVEHVKTRNGSDAMGKAIEAVSGPKEGKPKQAAA